MSQTLLHPPSDVEASLMLESENVSHFSRRKRTAIVGGVVVLLSILGPLVIRYDIWSMAHETTDDAYLAAHLHPISARVTDTVMQVAIDDNQRVAQGQVLVVLDPNDFRVRLDQARSALDVANRNADTARAAIGSTSQSATAETTEATGAIGEAKASIQAAKAGVMAASAGVPRAIAQLNEANATLQRDEEDLKRYEDLYAKEQVSKQSLDHQRANYQIALSARAAAQEQVRGAQAQLTAAEQSVARAEGVLTSSNGKFQSAQATKLSERVREAQFAAAQAAVEQAKAALEDAQLQLSYTTVRAPASGTIARKSVEAGQRVQSGQPLMAVVEDRPWIVANFKETQLERIRVGQPVAIQIDAFPSHTFHGRVDSLAPGSGNEFALLPPDNATGNFTKIVQRIPVKIVLDPDSTQAYEHLLSPGMSSVVTITTR